jgi:glycosyltransferase involved in cell wall biosynthesis
MFDPDDLIKAHRLGVVGHDVSELAESLRTLLASPTEWATCSRNAREHYLANYTVENVMPRFERVFIEAAARGQQAAVAN